MRARSTGLGKTELVLKPENLEKKAGHLIFSLRSIEPVNWRIRILIERRDLGRLILLALKGALCFWPLTFIRKPKDIPDDY